MLQGGYSAPLFTKEFAQERAAVHGIGVEEYQGKLSGFMQVLEHAREYNKIVLWFGNEPFCVANRKTVMETLRQYGYSHDILLNIVDETTGDILQQELFQM